MITQIFVPKLVALTVLLTAFLSLSGSIILGSGLNNVSPWLASLHPKVATGIILIGFTLRFNRQVRLRRAMANLYFLLSFGIGLVGFIILASNAGWYVVSGSSLELAIAPSEAAGLALILFGIATLLNHARAGFVAGQGILGMVILLCLTGLLAPLYRVEQSQPVWLMEAPAALLMLLSATTMLYQQSHRGPLGVVATDVTGRTVAKRLLPVAIVVPIGLGWLIMAAESAGLLHPPLTLLIHVLASIAVLAAIVWLSAISLARASSKKQKLSQAAHDIELAYRKLLDLSENPVFAYNGEGDVTYLNPAAKSLFSISGQECGEVCLANLVGSHAWGKYFAPLLLGVSAAENLQRISIQTKCAVRIEIDLKVVHLYRCTNDFELIAFVFSVRPALVSAASALKALANQMPLSESPSEMRLAQSIPWKPIEREASS